jgi:hypothetical protein
MSQRNQNAVAAQLGACNPMPLIRALNEGLDELRAERRAAGLNDCDTQVVLDDPALRLLVHQLAFLMKVGGDYDLSHEQYITACRAVGVPE